MAEYVWSEPRTVEVATKEIIVPEWVKEVVVVGGSSALAATVSALIAGKGKATPAAVAGAGVGGIIGWFGRKELAKLLGL